MAATGDESKKIVKADDTVLPHLESWERMMKLPVVEAAWYQSEEVYKKVKDFNPMFNWAFRTTENVVKGCVTLSAPIVNKFDTPISFVDQLYVKGLDKLEERAPIIKEQPAEILNQAKAKVMDVVQPQINKVCGLRKTSEKKAATLKELSYNKAKEVLATSYGQICVTGIDSTAVLAERLLDSFFPKTIEDDSKDDDKPISAEDDPVLHTVQTIGRLNNMVARRVYRTVSQQIKMIKKEDLTEYVASLIAVLRLTQYLNFLNERVQQNQLKKEDQLKTVIEGQTAIESN
ncbi:CLUMA_CG003267, isoform A [Clunio marinus]|uniref:CLUMA_CG003267, isoform A n=1 Tax=Clunio marinus TaxID=568069 RepID=A0A1J1HNK7_9DIPT|nr:CLUMA_CG003267, isoform A [Clunio marinus]